MNHRQLAVQPSRRIRPEHNPSNKFRQNHNPRGQMTREKVFHHPQHRQDHPLRLKREGNPYLCNGCQELGFGKRYCCDLCNYNLHLECATPRPYHPSLAHPFTGTLPFKFYWVAPAAELAGIRVCDACGYDVRGFAYHRRRVDRHGTTVSQYLHPPCMNLKRQLYYSYRHEQWKLVLQNTVPFKCLICRNQRCSGWSYVSTDPSNFKSCLHVRCMKQFILDKWSSGYFAGGNTNTAAPLPQGAQPRGRRKLPDPLFAAAKLTFKLAFSIIFGNPVSAVASLLEPLALIFL